MGHVCVHICVIWLRLHVNALVVHTRNLQIAWVHNGHVFITNPGWKAQVVALKPDSLSRTPCPTCHPRPAESRWPWGAVPRSRSNTCSKVTTDRHEAMWWNQGQRWPLPFLCPLKERVSFPWLSIIMLVDVHLTSCWERWEKKINTF